MRGSLGFVLSGLVARAGMTDRNFRVFPVNSVEAFIIAPHETLGAVALHLLKGNGNDNTTPGSSVGAPFGGWRIQGIRILPSLESNPTTEVTEIIYQGTGSQQIAINFQNVWAGHYHGFGNNAEVTQTAPDLTQDQMISSSEITSQGDLVWGDGSGTWTDLIRINADGSIYSNTSVNLPYDALNAYLDMTIVGPQFVDCSLDNGGTWIKADAFVSLAMTPANVNSIVFRNPATRLAVIISDNAKSVTGYDNKYIQRRDGDYKVYPNINPLPAGTPLGDVAVTRNVTFDRLDYDTTYGFSTNFPTWNSNPLGYIHPTTSTAIGRSDFHAEARVNSTLRWPRYERVVGEAPVPSTGQTPSGGVWWFHQNRYTSDATTISTVGELTCQFTNQRLPDDAGNWNRLIEVFLVDGSATRVGEIGFICSSPTETKTWHNTGQAIGSGLTDRYGRTWSCRKSGDYYSFIPTGGDFFSGSVDLANAFQYLITNGQYTGAEIVEEGYLYYDIEAVVPGGKIDVETTLLEYTYSEASSGPTYVWDGEINGNSGYNRPFGPNDGVTWDAVNKQIVMTRNVAAGVNSRVTFGPINPPVVGQAYTVKALLTVVGGSPSAGTTVGYSVNSNGSSATALPNAANGEQTYTIPAGAATGPIYLSFHQAGSTGSDNILRISRIGPVAAV